MPDDIYKKQITAFDDAYRQSTKNNRQDRWTRDFAIIQKGFVSRLPKMLKRGRVLDMGCGIGNVDIYLAQKGFQTYGFDASPAALAEAKKNAINFKVVGNTHFVLADTLKTLPFEKESFDACVDIGLLHHIRPEETSLYLNNLLAVLKQGGYYFLEVFSIHDGFRDKRKGSSMIIAPNLPQGTSGVYYERFFSGQELGSIFKPSFNIISLSEVPGTTPKRVLWQAIMQKT